MLVETTYLSLEDQLDKLAVSLLPWLVDVVVKDSFEGHHVAGTPFEYKHGWVKVGVGVDSTHLKLKKTGDVEHKPTGEVVGHVSKEPDTPHKGTTTFTAYHANGTKVYQGVYKGQAMAALARYHNHAVTKELPETLVPESKAPKKPGPSTKLTSLPVGSYPVFKNGTLVGYHHPASGAVYDLKGQQLGTETDDKSVLSHFSTGDSTEAPKLIPLKTVKQEQVGHFNPATGDVLNNEGEKIGTKKNASDAFLLAHKHYLATTKPEAAEPKTVPGTNIPQALTGDAAYKHAAGTQGQLTSTQTNAIALYGKTSGYTVVNPFLNKDGSIYNTLTKKYEPATPEQAKTAANLIKHLDSSFSKATPTTQPMIVHRRIGDSINQLIGPPGSHVGQSFTNKAYFSTTTAHAAKVGNGYAYENKKTLLDVVVPTGSHVILGNPHEKEVILPRGAKFTVLSDEVEPDGTRHVKLTYEVGSGEGGKPLPVAEPSVKPPTLTAPTPQSPSLVEPTHTNVKPSGTMTLKKPGSGAGIAPVGYYDTTNGTVYDAAGKPMGTSPSKFGALYLAASNGDLNSPEGQKAVSMGAKLTEPDHASVQPPGTVTLEKPIGKTPVGHYDPATGTVYDVSGKPVGTSPTQVGALHLAASNGDPSSLSGKVAINLGAKFNESTKPESTTPHDLTALTSEAHNLSATVSNQDAADSLESAGMSLEKGDLPSAVAHVAEAVGLTNSDAGHALEDPDLSQSAKDNFQEQAAKVQELHQKLTATLAATKPTPAPPTSTDQSNLVNAIQASATNEMHGEAALALSAAAKNLANGDHKAAIAQLEYAHQKLSKVIPGLHTLHYQHKVEANLKTIAQHLDAVKKLKTTADAAASGKVPGSHGTTGFDYTKHWQALNDLSKKVGSDAESNGASTYLENAADYAGSKSGAQIAQQFLKKAQEALNQLPHPTSDQLAAKSAIDDHLAVLQGKKALFDVLNPTEPPKTTLTAATGGLTQAVDQANEQVSQLGQALGAAQSSYPLKHLGMLDSKDLTFKQTGDVVDKNSGVKLGTVVKQKDYPSKGTTTFTVKHNDGTTVYQGVYKKEAQAALAQHHNQHVSGNAVAAGQASAVPQGTKPPTHFTSPSKEAPLPAGPPYPHGAKTPYAVTPPPHLEGVTLGEPAHPPVHDPSGPKPSATPDQHALALRNVRDTVPKATDLAKQPLLKTFRNQMHTAIGAAVDGNLSSSAQWTGNAVDTLDQITKDTENYDAPTRQAAAAARDVLKTRQASLVADSKLSQAQNTMKYGNMNLWPGEAYGGVGVHAAIHHPTTFGAGEKAAAKYWSGNGYMSLQAVLAGNNSSPTEINRVMKLRNLISRSVIEKPIAVQRAIPIEAANQSFGPVGSMVGKSFNEHRFIATTTNAYTGGFGTVDLHYHLPPGMQGATLNDSSLSHYSGVEGELLLNTGQRFKVLSDAVINGTRTIELEGIVDNAG